MNKEQQVGVRELRQNLSVYLRRVSNGETLEVTDHGKPVAMLAPITSEDLIDQLIAAGKIIPATNPSGKLGPTPKLKGRPLSEVLEEMRQEERY